jgi:hypothetical protein
LARADIFEDSESNDSESESENGEFDEVVAAKKECVRQRGWPI